MDEEHVMEDRVVEEHMYGNCGSGKGDSYFSTGVDSYVHPVKQQVND